MNLVVLIVLSRGRLSVHITLFTLPWSYHMCTYSPSQGVVLHIRLSDCNAQVEGEYLFCCVHFGQNDST